jgi:HTH-type transcriptional regulator/antitoxin HipB
VIDSPLSTHPRTNTSTISPLNCQLLIDAFVLIYLARYIDGWYLVGYIFYKHLGGYMNYTINLVQQLGPVLKGIRKKSGMTQKQVADKVGMLTKTISALEAGSPRSTLDSLMTLLGAYNYTLGLVEKTDDSSSALDW